MANTMAPDRCIVLFSASGYLFQMDQAPAAMKMLYTWYMLLVCMEMPLNARGNCAAAWPTEDSTKPPPPLLNTNMPAGASTNAGTSILGMASKIGSQSAELS